MQGPPACAPTPTTPAARTGSASSATLRSGLRTPCTCIARVVRNVCGRLGGLVGVGSEVVAAAGVCVGASAGLDAGAGAGLGASAGVSTSACVCADFPIVHMRGPCVRHCLLKIV